MPHTLNIEELYERFELQASEIRVLRERIAHLEKENAHLNRIVGRNAVSGLPDVRMGSAWLQDRLDSPPVRRSGQHAITVAMLDLDGLKRLNSEIGHFTVNELIKLVGARLKDRLYAEDYVIHPHGDEFIIVLSRTDLQDAPTALRRIHHEVFSEPFSVLPVQGGDAIRVDVNGSIGAVVWTRGQRGSAMQLFQAVSDVLLNEAKPLSHAGQRPAIVVKPFTPLS